MAVSEEPEVHQENAHLKEIEEFVFDQDIIVTYKKLSKMLNVHVNKAKRLLSLFVENTRQGKKEISVTYLVSGKEVDEASLGAWRVCVVPEDQLADIRKKFLPDTLSQHVYSIHQGTKAVDTGALISASKVEDNSPRNAGIENKNAKPHDQDKIQQLAKKAAMSVAPSKAAAVVNKKTVPEPTKPGKSSKQEEKPIKQEESSKTEEGKKEPASKAAPTISGMFAAQSGKSAETNGKKPASKPATNAKGGKKAAPAGNIASFFQRQKDAGPKKENSSKDSSPTTGTSDTAQSNSKPSDSSQTDSQQTDSQSSNRKVSPVTNGKTMTATSSKPSAKPSKATKKRKSKVEVEAPKKRKRIVAVIDSESSDDDESAEEVMEVEVNSPPPPVCLSVEDDEDDVVEDSKASANNTVSTIKEKKLVDKVFKDEKGFIVTKKEWVVETRTEEVEATEVKKKSPKTATEEPKPAAAKRKQTDLMSFFGRK